MKRLIAIILALTLVLTGVVYPMALAADEEYTVTLYGYYATGYGTAGVQNATVYINGQSYSMNNQGRVQVTLPAGTYTAYVRAVSSYSRTVRYGQATFTLPEASGSTIRIECNTDKSLKNAQVVYAATRNFDHIDIRSEGKLTVGSTVHDVYFDNIKIKVTDNGSTLVERSFTREDVSSYEWRISNISVPKTAVITATLDIYDSENPRARAMMYQGHTVSWSGKDDFTQAIYNCDQFTGLDFNLDAKLVLPAPTVQVDYEWEVFEKNDLGQLVDITSSVTDLPALPAGEELEEGESHTVDTTYTKDQQLTSTDDEGTQWIYTFSGWEKYYVTENDSHQAPLNAANPGTIEDVDADITVYGRWVRAPKITGKLVITKAFGDNSAVTADNFPSTGSSIEVIVTGPRAYSRVIVLNSANSYTATLEKLEMGSYKVIENYGKAYVPSYSLDSVTYNGGTEGTVTFIEAEGMTNPVIEATIEIENTYNKVYTNPVLPTLNVSKVRAGTTTKLQGAVFSLESDAGYAQTGTTDANGAVSFENLPAGNYTLTETQAPDTYSKEDATYTFTVAEASETVDTATNKWVKTYAITSVLKDGAALTTANPIVVENAKASGSVTVTKQFGVNSAVQAEEVSIALKKGESTVATFDLNEGNNWTYTVSGLEFGTYTVEEDTDAAQIEGYLLTSQTSPANGQVTIDATNDTATVTVTNTYATLTDKPAHLTVKKVNEEGEALEGAKFELRDMQGNVVATKETDQNGEIVFSGFAAEADYILVETEAPENYALAIEEYTVSVTMELVPSATAADEVIEEYSVAIMQSGEPADNYAEGVLTVVNEKMFGQLTVIKEVEIYVDGQQVQLAPDGREEEFSFTVTLGDVEENFSLKAGESKTFEDIPYGTEYTIVENLPENAAYVAEYEGEGAISQEETIVEVLNKYEYITWNAGFNGLKMDAETMQPIAGAEFTLYADAECTTVIGTAVSADDGTFGFEISEVGTYYLKETGAPENYKDNDTVYVVTAEKQFILPADQQAYADVVGDKICIMQAMVITAEELTAITNGAGTVYQITNERVPGAPAQPTTKPTVNPAPESTPVPENNVPEIPKTGDIRNSAILPVFFALAIMWVGVIGYIVFRKKVTH